MFQILIVEDDVEQAELYKAALAGGGYSIRMCPDGVSALATIDAGTPDLALLDVQLPSPEAMSCAGPFGRVRRRTTHAQS